MLKTIKTAVKAALITSVVAVAANAQVPAATPNLSGTVTLTGTVSKFVEINSGGAVTLTGNTSGGVTTDGTANNALAVVVDLGELGPTNPSSFVKASVPLKLRSNAAYVLSMSATFTSSGSTAEKMAASDIGFGLGATTRTGVGVASGTDVDGTSGDPTTGGATNATTGRWEYAGTNSTLDSFATSTTALSGPYIMRAVPRSNTGGMTVPAIFSVKPQFYENGSMTAVATFTVTTP